LCDKEKSLSDQNCSIPIGKPGGDVSPPARLYLAGGLVPEFETV
jgi:hypothetical protein